MHKKHKTLHITSNLDRFNKHIKGIRDKKKNYVSGVVSPVFLSFVLCLSATTEYLFIHIMSFPYLLVSKSFKYFQNKLENFNAIQIILKLNKKVIARE